MRALVASLTLLLVGCAGPAGRTSLLRVEQCADGGARLFAGVDDDGDGVLAAAEVDSTAALECREPAPGVAALKRCREQADCATPGVYCAGDGRCHPVEPGRSCVAALAAPVRDPHGPTIFDAAQDVIGTGGQKCTKDPAVCINDGNVCQFSFRWTDPENDVATERAALDGKLRVHLGPRPAMPPFDLPGQDGGKLRFSMCIDATLTAVALAVQLLDDAGHPSNALCFAGTAP